METASVRWIGHATVLVTLDGTRVITDPLLRRRVTHLRRRVPIAPEALAGVDAVLLSHAHHDHLDLPSLRRLGPSTPIVVPRGLRPLLRRQGFSMVHEMGIETGVSLERLLEASRAVREVLGRPLGSHVLTAGPVEWND